MLQLFDNGALRQLKVFPKQDSHLVLHRPHGRQAFQQDAVGGPPAKLQAHKAEWYVKNADDW
jgi:hypothetical protein